MADSKVKTISTRLVQWKIESLAPFTSKYSKAFKVGIWNWYLSVEWKIYLTVRLGKSQTCKEEPPLARFVLRFSNFRNNHIPDSTPIQEKLFQNCEFAWQFVCTNIRGGFIIDVEFLDLKISPLNGGEVTSIWPSHGTMQSVSAQSTVRCFSRMLEEAIHADITIHTADGTVRAHKAILSASSPVFASMFHHELKEKESSTIYMEDMSVDACKALLSYLYGSIKHEIFWDHRIALLGAANKYDITDLKDACEESLLEDINSGNVLERLQEAWLYKLNKLKNRCLTYLFEFGKIYEVKDELNNFIRQTDRELILEIIQQVLTAWRPV